MPSASRYRVKWGEESDDVIFSRSFIGGHLGLGGGEANSEQSKLLSGFSVDYLQSKKARIIDMNEYSLVQPSLQALLDRAITRTILLTGNTPLPAKKIQSTFH